MSANPAPLYQESSATETRAPRALRMALLFAALALVAACGFLWMRFGAQVFLDAALFAWRACF